MQRFLIFITLILSMPSWPEEIPKDEKNLIT